MRALVGFASKIKGGADVARQAATVLAVLFQIGGGALAGTSVGQVSAENPTLVVPTAYAFTVWVHRVGTDLRALSGLHGLPGPAGRATEPAAAARGVVRGRSLRRKRAVTDPVFGGTVRGVAGVARGHSRLRGGGTRLPSPPPPRARPRQGRALARRPSRRPFRGVGYGRRVRRRRTTLVGIGLLGERRKQRSYRGLRAVTAGAYRLLGAVPQRGALSSTAPAILRTGGDLPVALPAWGIIDGGMVAGIPDRNVRARNARHLHGPPQVSHLPRFLVGLDLDGTQNHSRLPDRACRPHLVAGDGHPRRRPSG